MRFMYLRKEGHPVAVLATSLIRAGHGNIRADMVAWALATCNPLDRFNRDLGKAIAAGRIYTMMPQRMVLVRADGGTKAVILGIISRDRTLPQRAREAARQALAMDRWVRNVTRGPKKTDTPALVQIEGTVDKVLAKHGNGKLVGNDPEDAPKPRFASDQIKLPAETKADMEARSALFKEAREGLNPKRTVVG